MHEPLLQFLRKLYLVCGQTLVFYFVANYFSQKVFGIDQTLHPPAIHSLSSYEALLQVVNSELIFPTILTKEIFIKADSLYKVVWLVFVQ